MTNEKLERKIKQRDILNAQIRQMQARENKKKRRDDTRRKILVGAAVLDEAETNVSYKNALYDLLARFLSRTDDRALFGFPPLPGNQIKTARKPPEKPKAPEEN
jgi:hypothetical protein